MEITRRRFGAFTLGALAGSAMAAPPNRPRLVVLLVVEQFRADLLDLVGPQLGTGGLRRLLEKGSHVPDCRHSASTFSSTTLATLATGAWPAEHGIVADSWYDRAAKRAVRASDEALLATTLAAQVTSDSRARVWVLGMDGDRTRMFAGTSEASLIWMDERGLFTGRGEELDWLATFNAQHSPEAVRNRKWQAVGARQDTPPLRTMVWDEQKPASFMALYKASPYAQDAQFELLGELLTREKLGQPGSFDFVCMLVGSSERLGYDVGGTSPLMAQMALQLDKRVEAMLAQLAKAAGDTGYTVVLVGAHGAPPEPPLESRDRMAVNGEKIAQAVEHRLSEHGLGHVVKYLYPFLYLDTSGFREPGPIRMAAARAAMEQAPVAGYYTADGAGSTHDDWQRRFRNSFHATRSGDVMLSYRPEYVEDFAQGRGVSYGSLYNYDVRVPLCFFGPQFRAGVYDAPVESVDLAPTLARVMGVAEPSSTAGRVLAEVLVG